MVDELLDIFLPKLLVYNLSVYFISTKIFSPGCDPHSPSFVYNCYLKQSNKLYLESKSNIQISLRLFQLRREFDRPKQLLLRQHGFEQAAERDRDLPLQARQIVRSSADLGLRSQQVSLFKRAFTASSISLFVQ